MPRFAANLTMLFAELPFLDRFAAAKAAGFGGVEYLFPYDFEKAALREQLQQHGLTQVLHNLPAGNWGAGERGIAILPDRVDEFRDGVLRAIDYAKALDCRQLNCLVGVAPRCRRPCARAYSSTDRADQHAGYPGFFPQQDSAGGSDHRRRRIG